MTSGPPQCGWLTNFCPTLIADTETGAARSAGRRWSSRVLLGPGGAGALRVGAGRLVAVGAVGPAEAFASQSDAESWIGQSWRDLSANGVLKVALYEENRLEYRMPLTPVTTE